MYTLLELESKTFGELKKIGSELNVIPEGDRRRRETWIDAIAGVNPPLLQLLEVSPAVEPALESPIIETVENSSGVEVEPAQEAPLESKFGRIVYPRPVQESNAHKTDKTDTDRVRAGSSDLYMPWHIGTAESKASSNSFESGADNSPLCDKILGTPGDSERERRQTLLDQSVELAATGNPPGVEVDPVEDQQFPECVECFDDGFVEDESGVIKLCQCGSEPKLSRESVQSALAPAAKNLPSSRSKTSTAHQLLELFKSSAQIIEDSPGVKTEATVSGSAIEPAVKNSIDAESDPNPILTGIPLSDRFVARYSPPQPENIIFKSEPDGQLSLLDFEVQSQDEPPDPDDFASLDAFREAITRWDREHPISSDHCSDLLPSSAHCEPPDPGDYDSMFAFWAAYDAWDEASDDDSEPLEISLDSFCEWAPCPLDWYEPASVLEPSKVSELSAVAKSSITSEFFIPTFGRWGDRFDRNDEPPNTGIFARLPKPKPPNFPPQASQPKQVSRASRNYPETIPKQFSRVAAGSSTQPARSPPGGDALPA